MRTQNLPIGIAATLLAVLFAAGASRASDFQIGNLLIEEPWSRPTAPATSVGVAYLTITNRGSLPDRLIALSSPVADSVEIHVTHQVGSVMEMRQLAGVDCPPRATVKIEPGGVHVMLIGLHGPLALGSDFPLTLRFAKTGAVTVEVHVGLHGATSEP